MYPQEWSFASHTLSWGVKHFGSLSKHKVARSASGHDFTACGKNSDFDFVLKGRGFSRAVSAAKSRPALAAEGTLGLQCHFFRSLFNRAASCRRYDRLQPLGQRHMENF